MLRSAKFWLVLGGLLLTVAVITAAVWRGFHGAAAEVKVAVAEERLFEDKVLAAGEVETTRRAVVVAPFAGRLLSLKAQEGDSVTAGQVLGELDAADVKDQVKEAEAALAAAEAELAAALEPGTPVEIAQAEAALAAAKAAAEAAAKKLERYHYLFEQEAASQAELEAAEIEYEQARAEMAAAEARLKGLTEADERTLAVYRARVRQALAAAESARRLLEKARLTAPIAGTVLETRVKEGDYLQPGTPVLTIGDPAQLQVVAELSEQDVRGIAPGQEVEIRWIGDPEKTWEGEVFRVAPAVTKKLEREVEKIVRVYVTLKEGGLLPGATVDTVIHRVKPHEALLVPTEAVVEVDGKKVIFTVERGKARKRTVTAGGANELYTVIRQGLEAGAMVILDPEELKDGQPVRATGGAQG